MTGIAAAVAAAAAAAAARMARSNSCGMLRKRYSDEDRTIVPWKSLHYGASKPQSKRPSVVCSALFSTIGWGAQGVQ